jgi:hypothetical protein
MSALFPLGQIVATPGALAALESKTAACLFLGPSCNWGLGRTGANRCRREQVQPDSRVSIAEQLPDGCRREAMDNHRSGPICNHAAFARGVLKSFMNRLV